MLFVAVRATVRFEFDIQPNALAGGRENVLELGNVNACSSLRGGSQTKDTLGSSAVASGGAVLLKQIRVGSEFGCLHGRTKA